MRLPSTLVRALWLLGALLLCAAQGPQSRFPPGAFQNRAAIDGGGVAAYVGPGDVIASATAWWGLRGYTAAYSTGSNPAADVCDSATGLTCVTANITSGGNLDTSGLGTVCAVACRVKKLYDQTGNGFHLEGVVTHTSWPVLSLTGIGSKPGMLFSSSASTKMVSVSGPSVSTWTDSVVASRTANFTSVGTILSADATNSAQADFDIVANGVVAYNGGGSAVTATASDSSFHAMQFVFNSTSSALNVDGSNTTGTTDAGAWGQPIVLGDNIAGTSFGTVDGTIGEAGVWPVAFSGANSSAMSSNQHSYWGF